MSTFLFFLLFFSTRGLLRLLLHLHCHLIGQVFTVHDQLLYYLFFTPNVFYVFYFREDFLCDFLYQFFYYLNFLLDDLNLRTLSLHLRDDRLLQYRPKGHYLRFFLVVLSNYEFLCEVDDYLGH